MLTRTARLDSTQLAAVRALADEVVAHDGGRLKLELAHLEATPAEAALAHERGRLVGFGAVYVFGGAEPELAGMVAPDARRQGVGSALLESLLPDLSCPLLGLFGNDDAYPSPAEVAELDRILTELGKEHEFHRYDGAGHAFFASWRPSYRVDAAVDGWERIRAFFGRHLA